MLWCSHPLPVLNRGVHGESDRRGHPDQGVPVHSVYPGHSFTPVPFPGNAPTVSRAGPLFERVYRYADAVDAHRDSSDLSGCPAPGFSAYPAHAGIPGCHPRLNQCSPCVCTARMASRENGKPGNEQNPRKRYNPGPGSAASLHPDASGPGPVSIICPRKSLIPVDETLLSGTG